MMGAPRPGAPQQPPSAAVSALPRKTSTPPAKPVRPLYWSRVPDSRVTGTVWEGLSDGHAVFDVAIVEDVFAKGAYAARVLLVCGFM